MSDAEHAKTVLQGDDFARMLKRIAHEILESERGANQLLVLGIHTRGVPIATRLAQLLGRIDGSEVPHGALDVTMYRDDLASKPTRASRPTSIPEGTVNGRTVVLVDDVLFSGRTIRAALDALADHGRANAVRLAVLVDRGHRELPIRADFVGKNLPSSRSERVLVQLEEIDGTDAVLIESSAGDTA